MRSDFAGLDVSWDIQPCSNAQQVRSVGVENRADTLTSTQSRDQRCVTWTWRISSRDLPHCAAGQTVAVAGMVVVRQAPPTAKGFRFLTLEDEFGFINVIVRPQVYPRFRQILLTQPLLLVRGTLQHERAVSKVLLESVSPLLGRMS